MVIEQTFSTQEFSLNGPSPLKGASSANAIGAPGEDDQGCLRTGAVRPRHKVAEPPARESLSVAGRSPVALRDFCESVTCLIANRQSVRRAGPPDRPPPQFRLALPPMGCLYGFPPTPVRDKRHRKVLESYKNVINFVVQADLLLNSYVKSSGISG